MLRKSDFHQINLRLFIKKSNKQDYLSFSFGRYILFLIGLNEQIYTSKHWRANRKRLQKDQVKGMPIETIPSSLPSPFKPQNPADH
jgi:hypothetical protein